MRINRPNGPSGTASTSGAKATGKAGGVKFAKHISGAGAAEDSTEKARKVRNWLLEELTGLAKDVKEGKATKEEATRKFVHMVVKEKMNGVSGAGQAAMEESISEMCESDPQFVTRLHNELNKMARS